MSMYLDRVKEFCNQPQNTNPNRLSIYESPIGSQFCLWGSECDPTWHTQGNTHTSSKFQNTLENRTFDEISEGLYRAVIINEHYSFQKCRENCNQNGHEQEKQFGSKYAFIIYRENSFGDFAPKLDRLWSFADEVVYRVADSQYNREYKKLVNKLRLKDKAYKKLYRINELSTEWVSPSNLTQPFNVVEGSEVFIDKFGRYRKGVVIEVRNSKFVVAYTTPRQDQTFRLAVKSFSDLRVEIPKP